MRRQQTVRKLNERPQFMNNMLRSLSTPSTMLIHTGVCMLLVALYVLLPATTIMVRVADSIFGHWGGVGVKMYPSVSFRFFV